MCSLTLEDKGTLDKCSKLSDSAITITEVRWRLSQWREGERQTEEEEERERGGGNRARKSWRLNHGSQTDLYIPTPTLIYIYIYGHRYAFAFTAPDLSHHHFFPLFPRFHLILNTNTLVWAQCVQTCKSHLHTCRLHKRAVVFTVFQISESCCFTPLSHHLIITIIQMHANIWM